MPGVGKTTSLLKLKHELNNVHVIPEVMLKRECYSDRNEWISKNDLVKSKGIENFNGIVFLDRYYMSTNVINEIKKVTTNSSHNLLKPSIWIILHCSDVEMLYERINNRSEKLSGPWEDDYIFKIAFQKYLHYSKTGYYDGVPVETIEVSKSSTTKEIAQKIENISRKFIDMS